MAKRRDEEARSKAMNDRPLKPNASKKRKANETVGNEGRSKSLLRNDDDDFVDPHSNEREARSKAMNDRPQKPNASKKRKANETVGNEGRSKSLLRDDDDDFIDPHSNEREARSKAMNDRPQKPNTSKKRKANETVRNEAQGKEGNKKCAYKDYPKLSTRTTTVSLVKLLEEPMNENQQKAIKDLGFEHILRLSITEIPSRLAYWLVDHFDHVSFDLELERGKSIHVEALDVHRVFGFPKGKIPITRLQSDAKSTLIDEYKNLFKPKDGSEIKKIQITQKEIVEKMLADKEGGIWFKRHFIAMLVSSLIENSSSGYVNPKILQHLEDLEKVRDMDWCTYTLQCLGRSKEAWKKQKHKAFLGSALFLTVFYVDRVSAYGKLEKRSFPIFSNWNDQILRDRQKKELTDGEVGRGHPIEPIVVQLDPTHKNAEQAEEHVSAELDASEEENYAKKMYVHAKHVAEKMVELMEMIERAPASNNEYFQKAMRTSQKLCSGGQARGQAHGNQLCTQPSQFASTQADNFWGKEEVLKIIQEVEAANPKKDKPSTTTTSYQAWVDDMPSFDLGIGFTSEEPNLEPASDSGNKVDLQY